VLAIGLSILARVRQFFQGNPSSSATPGEGETASADTHHKKMFDDNEGEYVEFEEVKDEE